MGFLSLDNVGGDVEGGSFRKATTRARTRQPMKAIIAKLCRHPMCVIRIARGVLPLRAPMVPAAMVMPKRKARLFGENQRAATLLTHRNAAADPAPRRSLPNFARSRLSVEIKIKVPKMQSEREAKITLLTP